VANKKELRALITLAGKIDPSLQNALKAASKMSTKVSKDIKKSSNDVKKSTSVIKSAFQSIWQSEKVKNFGSTLLEAGKRGLMLASDLNEIQKTTDATFGKDAGQINDWAQKAKKSFGLSELQAKQYTGTLGAMMKGSGIAGDKVAEMSEKLTGLSGDFASFYNLSQDDAFEKIRSGISGDTEPLMELGINMSDANLQAYALSKGINTSYEQMDDAAKTTLRYNYLMEETKILKEILLKIKEGSLIN
jgi:hypothetical protein